jgi:hypothetical protein
MQAVLAPECLSPLPSRNLKPVFSSRSSFFFSFSFLAGHDSSVYLFAHQDDVRTTHFSTATTMSTLTSATLALKGYHLYVILIDFYSNHNMRVITML